MKKFLVVFLAICSFLMAKNDVKLVVLDPAAIEILYGLGAQGNIAAISKTSMGKIWPKEQTDKLANVGSYMMPSLEKIAALNPSHIITSYHSMRICDDAKNYNIKATCIALQANSLEDIYKNIDKLANITNTQDKAKQVISELKANIQNLKSASNLKGKKIMGLFSASPMVAFGGDTLPHSVFISLGMQNIAGDIKIDTSSISPEFILANDPDYIVLLTGSAKQFIKEYPSLSNIKAVKNNNIVVLNTMLLRGSQRIHLIMQDLVNKLNHK